MEVAGDAGSEAEGSGRLVRRPSVRCRACRRMISLCDCVQRFEDRMVLVCPHCHDHELVGSARSR
jgi:hypothetical protein